MLAMGTRALYLDRNTESMFSIYFRKNPDEKTGNDLFTLIVKKLILLVRAFITSMARGSSVFPSSYRNTIFNQSTRAFFQGCLLDCNLLVSYVPRIFSWF